MKHSNSPATAAPAISQATKSLSPDLATLLLALGRPKTQLTVGRDTASLTTRRAAAGKPPAIVSIALDLVRTAADLNLIAAVATETESATVPSAQVFVLTDEGRRMLVEVLKTTQPSKHIRPRGKPEIPDTPVHPLPTEAHRRLTVIAQLRSRKDRGRRPLLSEAEASAGDKLAYDFNRGALQPRVTANWDPSAIVDRSVRAAPDTARAVSDGTSQAQERVRQALDHVGPGLAGVLMDVCCFEAGLETVESNHGWARGTARTVLQIALHQLADFYGLLPSARHDRGDGMREKSRHWGETDFKPTAQRWRDAGGAGAARSTDA